MGSDPRRRKAFPALTSTTAGFVLCAGMPVQTERAVLTVVRHDGAWAVEQDGEHFDHSQDKEVVKASANKRARQMQDAGKPCQVRVSGELGYFAAR